MKTTIKTLPQFVRRADTPVSFEHNARGHIAWDGVDQEQFVVTMEVSAESNRRFQLRPPFGNAVVVGTQLNQTETI